MQDRRLRALFFRSGQNPVLTGRILEFRKGVFVDRLGWKLNVVDGLERDEFDHSGTLHCALLRGAQVVGAFRAIRCDRPYLSAFVFPKLAQSEPYPSTWDAWEISRFAVVDRVASWPLYAAMLNFGWARQARALVALVDLGHERMLGRLGIKVHRYGDPASVGTDRDGRPIVAVAGEIPLREQSPALHAAVAHALSNLELNDETLVLGPDRVSA
ncbi:acyl-homoserine-lactone synthase [Xanthobacter sp. V0B-10]|uniref:acyl-homoserine-lactone synthase n=1 Tax=Xanthobacter albus TaxID=3119929 RepID=UPI00372668AC